MSPYQIDEIFLLGFGMLNDKEGEENDEETETLQWFYTRMLWVFERMSSKYIDIIEKDSQCIAIKRFQHNSVPTFNDVNYNIQISPIREVSIKFNVFKKEEKIKGKWWLFTNIVVYLWCDNNLWVAGRDR